ncbi:MAG: hypothetical protein J6T28_09460 [Paludibacteraceae bacterium]|nr:hypothetical protein [Paludibacteraceae bacterium]
MVDFVNVKKRAISFLPLLFFAMVCMGAVPVHINSGNPAYPFPQFLEYACGGNLGTKSPEGISHAEMEKYIREAYQQHANLFGYTGDEHQGIKYIEPLNEKNNPAYGTSESDGYALLAAAYMADKTTFDGLWMYTHDALRVVTKKYMDCSDNMPDYLFGDLSLSWRNNRPDDGSAADADVDIALALYVAYKQWGEFMRNDKGEIVKDACDEPISYKQEMINVIRGLVAMQTSDYTPLEGARFVYTGAIGLDGYMKPGNKYGEVTDWAYLEENSFKLDGLSIMPSLLLGARGVAYTDYSAPAYFREFHDLLDSLSNELGETNAWEMEQFRRGEASSDWLIGELIGKSEKAVPTAGQHTVSRYGDTTSFMSQNMGEDFRCPWRTISNYVWHGSPKYTWNPATHQVVDGANAYERNAALRLSDFMRDPAHWTSKNSCVTLVSPDEQFPAISGPRIMCQQVNPMTGELLDNFGFIGRSKGASSFAAVGAQDYALMGDLFNVIYEHWDVQDTTADGQKIAKYMDGWFRQLGLMALTGNYAAPSQMKAQPNLKIYRAVKDSVSFCHVGDTITYLLSYRNYGSVDAQNVSIVENVPDDFIFLDADNGGTYDASTHTVEWTLSKLAGFKSDEMEGASIDFSASNLSKTIGEVSYRCVAKEGAKGRYQASAEISCSNGLGSKTDIYPNYVTATMQRNAIDVIPANLAVVKVADVTEVATGDLVTFNVSLSNDTVPALTGGRSGVNVAMSETAGSGSFLKIAFRLYHDAVEPYIDNGNYRVSIFKDLKNVKKLKYNAFYQAWDKRYSNGNDALNVTFEDNVLADSTHMITIQFPHAQTISTIYAEVNRSPYHATSCDGLSSPDYMCLVMEDDEFHLQSDIDWNAGFSQIPDTNRCENLSFPVTPSFQTSSEPQPVDLLLRSACDEVSKLTENVLVEEFDGYTWRKILGNAPAGYGDVETNVTLTDTIPLGFEFVKFTDENTTATYQPASATANPRPNGREASFKAAPDGAKNYSGIVTYTLNRMNTGEKNSFSYQCRLVATDADTIRCVSHVSSDKESVNSAPLVLYIKEATSLPSVEAESPYVDVYNMLGVMLKKQVLREKALDGLMPGVYVVGNQKMVKIDRE